MSRPHLYILEGKDPIPTEDVVGWGRWFEKTEDRIVAKTKVRDNVEVSTVFLGIDHSFSLTGPPVLFETMVFGGEEDDYQERYRTWAEAEAGHRRIVEWVRRDLGASNRRKRAIVLDDEEP